MSGGKVLTIEDLKRKIKDFPKHLWPVLSLIRQGAVSAVRKFISSSNVEEKKYYKSFN